MLGKIVKGHELGKSLADGEGRGPDMLQSVGLQRVRYNLSTEHNIQKEYIYPQLFVGYCCADG